MAERRNRPAPGSGKQTNTGAKDSTDAESTAGASSSSDLASQRDADMMGEPAGRGRLRIANKVVEKIAAMAAHEVDQVTEHRAGLRLLPGRGLPRASAEVAGGHVRIGVEIATPWPASLAQVASQTREHVEKRVSALTGMNIVAVDVSVADVVHVATEERRVR